MGTGFQGLVSTRSPAATSKHTSVQLDPDEFRVVQEKFLRPCTICKSVKPPRAHHCRRCGRCVMRMDHHCPWVSNCIGLKNTKFFLLFTFYVTLLAVFNIADYVTRGVLIWKRGQPLRDVLTDIQIGLLAASALLTVVYALFSMSMFYNQLQMIQEGTTKIDELPKAKARRGAETKLNRKLPYEYSRQKKTTKEKLTEVMGDQGYSLWWLIPI